MNAAPPVFFPGPLPPAIQFGSDSKISDAAHSGIVPFRVVGRSACGLSPAREVPTRAGRFPTPLSDESPCAFTMSYEFKIVLLGAFPRLVENPRLLENWEYSPYRRSWRRQDLPRASRARGVMVKSPETYRVLLKKKRIRCLFRGFDWRWCARGRREGGLWCPRRAVKKTRSFENTRVLSFSVSLSPSPPAEGGASVSRSKKKHRDAGFIEGLYNSR